MCGRWRSFSPSVVSCPVKGQCRCGMGAFICLLKVIFSPFILVFWSIWIYFVGCIGAYLSRCARCLACGVCVCCNCTYKDKSFPASARSIGPWKNKSAQQVDQEIAWKRIRDVCARSGQTGARLFSGKIEPHDICQGQLGDCWLMSACACLATQEGAIQRVFLTDEYTAYGRYRMRLFDGANMKWKTVVVDDWMPCSKSNGQAVFAKPNGDEAWVLLLEKAMAKFKGSYAALDGGSTLWALECLTGDYCFKFKQEMTNGKIGWLRLDLVHPKQPKGDVLLSPTRDVLTPNEMFETMLFYNRRRSVIAASSGGNGNDTQNVNGIVQGHAYAVVAVKEIETFKLVKLRNPWGTFEWQGAWGDKSSLWKQYPKVARAVDFEAKDDGAFWMCWEDFSKYFKNLDFCMRTTGWDDLRLQINEEHPCCGPLVGCLAGCGKFWCCCQGCRALCCAKQERSFERAPKGCCANCVAGC